MKNKYLIEIATDPRGRDLTPHARRICPICEQARLIEDDRGVAVCEENCPINIWELPQGTDVKVGWVSIPFYSDDDDECLQEKAEDLKVIIDTYKQRLGK